MNPLLSRVNSKFLLTAVVVTCLFLVVFIVFVGGVICIRDSKYTFSEYLKDLLAVYKLLGVAVIAAIGSAWVNGKKGA